MPKPRRPSTRQPGTSAVDANAGQPAQDAGESDVDAAIDAAASGKAHKVPKARAAVPASKIKGDPERPAEAAVNAKKEMNYEQAMKALAARHELDRLRKYQQPTDEQLKRIAVLEPLALMRNVLTEQGWVCVNRDAPGSARV